jgi:hypothetical protein
MEIAKIGLKHDRSVLFLSSNDYASRDLQIADIERGKREAVSKRIVEKQTRLSDIHRCESAFQFKTPATRIRVLADITQ